MPTSSAEGLPAPIVVVGRPHSGTRILAHALQGSRWFGGMAVTPGFLDSIPWWMRFVAPLMVSRWFPRWPDPDHDPAFARFCRMRLDDTLARFFGSRAPGGAWGWKFPETLFVMPILARVFPGARFVHLLRDGRDVCVSDRGFFQLTGDHADPAGWDLPALRDAAAAGVDPAAPPTFRQFCMAVTFGDAALRTWNGIDLDDRAQLVENRFLLQMQSWRHCVEAARAHGGALGDHYIEVRYETLCRHPVKTVEALFARLGLQLGAAARAYLEQSVHIGRIGTWKAARLTRSEARDFERALALAAPLLREFDNEGSASTRSA